jgi:hypothetical protein
MLDGLSLGIEDRALWHYPHVCFHALIIAVARAFSGDRPAGIAGRCCRVYSVRWSGAIP